MNKVGKHGPKPKITTGIKPVTGSTSATSIGMSGTAAPRKAGR